MNLGENIYQLRTAKNLSQGDLADALEVSRQSVSKWENNSAVPELEKLIKMAQLFKVTLDELVGKERLTQPEVNCYPPVEPKLRQSAPTKKVVGIILLCCGFLTFVVFAALSFVENMNLDFSLSLLLSAPFILCGIICLLCKYNPGYFCTLAVYGLVWLLLFVFSIIRYGTTACLCYLSVICLGTAVLIYTAIRLRSDKLNMHIAVKIVIIFILTLSLFAGLRFIQPSKEVGLINGDGVTNIGIETTLEMDATVLPN